MNQAHVRTRVLARLENAAVVQSLELRVAWGTPCVQFGPDGWALDLSVDPSDGASHSTSDGAPAAVVSVFGAWREWAPLFSHELMEMLVDPYVDLEIDGRLFEVCDPVEGSNYQLDGVPVSDFVWPSWFFSHYRRGRLDQMGVLEPNGVVVTR